MARIVLKVEGMSCAHCEKCIVETVGGLAGVSGVKVDLNAKEVIVDGDSSPALRSVIEEAIEDQGYEVVK